MALMRTVNK